MMVLNIAHRGGSKIAPENTLAAMSQSFDLDVDMIEFDVRLTKDDHLVVIHDASVNRTTNGTGFVRDLTLKQIKHLDAGQHFDLHYRGESVPQPFEIFEILPKDMRVNIHLKDYRKTDNTQEIKIIQLVRDYNLVKRVLIVSKYAEVLVRVHKIEPTVETVFLSRQLAEEEYIRYSLKLKCKTVQPTIWWMSPEFFRKAKKQGLKINVFWADHPETMRMLIENEVDGILTNRPDILKRLLRKSQ